MVNIGAERIVMTDGLQPFGFQTADGTIVVQAQLRFPPGYQPPTVNAFPGLPGIVVSRDGGQTWRRWIPTAKQGLGPTIEGAAVTLRDGATLLVEWIADGPDENHRYQGKLWESNDNFETVQGPFIRDIDIPQAKIGFDDGGHPYSGVTFHRTLLELPNGDLLAAVYCWFEGDDTPCSYQPTMNKFRTVVLRSTERGRSWKYLATVAVDPAVGQEGFNEPVMVRLEQGAHAGRLVCVMRTGSIDCALYQAHSDDDGASWSQPRELEMHGVDPDMVEMQDGTLVCSYGRRMNGYHDERRYYIALSHDGGDTWLPPVTMPWIEPYAHTFAAPQGNEAWPEATETHYTTILETDPGTLLLMYDVGTWSSPVRYTAYRQIQVSI